MAIPDKWRSINNEALERLADSMNQIGLQTPISVRLNDKGLRLVAGRHRLEAAKKLGWRHIDAIVMRDDPLERQIWHQAENLDRANLTALEHAEALAKRAKLVAEKAEQETHREGHQPHDKGVSKAAKAMGVSRDNVRRSKPSFQKRTDASRRRPQRATAQ